jgi:Rps23 Pro-64 3,4-dihydroxylase Tpa1-like proline 4-hydroxylase
MEALKNIKEKIQRVNGSEFQLTMNSNGDFYKPHPDTDKKVKIPKIRQRKFTLVYYVFNEPKSFTGGDLVIYEKTNEEGKDYNENDFITITPENNMLVMFPSEYWHEVKTVNNDGNLTNNRFTINIWIH